MGRSQLHQDFFSTYFLTVWRGGEGVRKSVNTFWEIGH